MRFIISLSLSILIWGSSFLQAQDPDSAYIAAHFDKKEYRIPMRDGVTLFTAVYTPKDQSQEYPILFFRTPYRVAPYGESHFPKKLGPSPLFIREPFIHVYQDVRGRFMSEGEFEDMRPQLTGSNKDKTEDIDESTDVWDTIEWLINNLSGHNSKVGMYGISYPGFYTAAGAINSHPNLVCASPQAPIADWWYDDFHHHGAAFLPHCFNFMSVFGLPRHGFMTQWPPRFKHGTPDGYQFFLEEMGPVKNARLKFLGDSIRFWNDYVSHPNYDEFWQARNLLPHLKNVNCAVLTVGGWFDAEDLYGPLNIYRALEKNNPNIQNALVMGPWGHGGWARTTGSFLGPVYFGEKPTPSSFFQNQIEFPFFMHHLKGKAYPELPEAYVFETGNNQWHQLDTWPPERDMQRLYFHPDGSLQRDISPIFGGTNSFVSDPAHPVPSFEEITTGMPKTYMTADQRFASRRPDVLVYQTEVLTEDLTMAGPLLASLLVSTSESDADWIVKLIDVYPSNHPGNPHEAAKGVAMGGYQQMVRSEVIRGRFRNNKEKPEPFVPNQMDEVDLPLQDIFHTFKAGHRIMVQIQSTWFPMVDRNPQKWVDNIFEADEEDFVKATHTLYCDPSTQSFIEFGVFKP